MMYLGLYLLIAFCVAVYCGVDIAIAKHGKLDIDSIALPIFIGILWPGTLAFLAVFGIGFLFKILCEKIAKTIIGITKPDGAKVGLESTIKTP